MTSTRFDAGVASPSGADDGFARAIDAHRRDVILLAYRFLGSLSEAEEAAQETALRAWRGRDSFRGDASLRTWLHRIATRVCLDVLADRKRRVLPPEVAAPARATAPPVAPTTDVQWLEPIPDAYLADEAADPEARYSLRESVTLAFVAAMQALPARQRAVLLLRDVLSLSAAEAASALGMSLGAANSALFRARSTLRERYHAAGEAGVPVGSLDDPAIRRTVDAYVRAWESDDVRALVETLRDDVRLAMPPSPSWYAGRDAVAGFVGQWLFASGRQFRLPRLESGANGQPAVGFEEETPDGRVVLGIQVLDVRPDGIAEIMSFMDPAIAARFDATSRGR